MVQLIDQREKLREKYVNDPSIERPAIYTSDKDKQFLDKLQAIIEQELGNSEIYDGRLCCPDEIGAYCIL